MNHILCVHTLYRNFFFLNKIFKQLNTWNITPKRKKKIVLIYHWFFLDCFLLIICFIFLLFCLFVLSFREREKLPHVIRMIRSRKSLNKILTNERSMQICANNSNNSRYCTTVLIIYKWKSLWIGWRRCLQCFFWLLLLRLRLRLLPYFFLNVNYVKWALSTTIKNKEFDFFFFH